MEEQQKIMGRFTLQGYLEDNDVIKAKASDMLDHYINTVFTNGFKAQIVSISREGAYRYKKAIDELLPEKIKILKQFNPLNIDIRQLEKVKAACIISTTKNDMDYLKPFGDENTNKDIVAGFKKSFNESKEDGRDSNYGILVVTNMLLTGFDASIEQAMYLDKPLYNHNLLQAIARVNRTHDNNKKCGYLVDYVGVTRKGPFQTMPTLTL
jgi:type I restriction enzyme R subunit